MEARDGETGSEWLAILITCGSPPVTVFKQPSRYSASPGSTRRPHLSQFHPTNCTTGRFDHGTIRAGGHLAAAGAYQLCPGRLQQFQRWFELSL